MARESPTPESTRYMRESLFAGALRDSLGPLLTTEELTRKELVIDKQLIKIIQMVCKEGHLQKALDCAALLHHTPSFDGAAKIASFYQLLGLKEKIEQLKDNRLTKDRLEQHRSDRSSWSKHSRPIAVPVPRQSNEDHSRATFLNGEETTARRRPLQLATPLPSDETPTSTFTSRREIDPDVELDEPSFFGDPELDADSGKRKREETLSPDDNDSQFAELPSEQSVSKKRVLTSGGASVLVEPPMRTGKSHSFCNYNLLTSATSYSGKPLCKETATEACFNDYSCFGAPPFFTQNKLLL